LNRSSRICEDRLAVAEVGLVETSPFLARLRSQFSRLTVCCYLPPSIDVTDGGGSKYHGKLNCHQLHKLIPPKYYQILGSHTQTHKYFKSTQIQVSIHIIMSASQDQTPLNAARGAGTTFGPDSTSNPSTATPSMSVGSATAAGHGDHPNDKNADVSNVSMPNSKVGPQQGDLDGEQMHPQGEGEVMDAQADKKNAGWGEQDSLTSDLDRQKAEQKGAREEIQAERSAGRMVDGGAGERVENEGMSSV
jgi:hypothetical protein